MRVYSVRVQRSACIEHEVRISENEVGILLVPRRLCEKSHIFRYLLLGTVQVLYSSH